MAKKTIDVEDYDLERFVFKKDQTFNVQMTINVTVEVEAGSLENANSDAANTIDSIMAGGYFYDYSYDIDETYLAETEVPIDEIANITTNVVATNNVDGERYDVVAVVSENGVDVGTLYRPLVLIKTPDGIKAEPANDYDIAEDIEFE